MSDDLEEVQSELDSVQSELEEVQSELETANDELQKAKKELEKVHHHISDYVRDNYRGIEVVNSEYLKMIKDLVQAYKEGPQV